MSHVISQELAILLQQQERDWDDIQILKEKLRAKQVAYAALGDRISAQIAREKAARNESTIAAVTQGSGDRTAPTAHLPNPGSCACPTHRAVSMVDAMDRVLARLPHTGEL